MALYTALCVAIMGMTKGGFPVGPIALPLLILLRHGEQDAARHAVAFMLPLLCCMDIVALVIYRRHVPWDRIKPLLLPSLAGIAVAGSLFVAAEGTLVAVSERALRLAIGCIGLIFVAYRASLSVLRRALIRHASGRPGRAWSVCCGLVAGVTSTIAHAAGPVLQMYLLPQRLEKRAFASSNAAFFFVVNAVKLIPFVGLGRIDGALLSESAAYLPVIPLGVLAGYGAVHVIPQRAYTLVIYTALFVASSALILS